MERGMWILEQHHAHVMRVAAELLSQRGYDNVRAEDLARAASVSVGTLYRRYGDKHRFALAVRDFAEQDLCDVARSTFEGCYRRSKLDFREAFLAFWGELVWWAAAQPGLFGFAFLHWHPRALEERSPGEAAREMVREVLRQGEREGVLAPGAARAGEG
ncbi:TetR/AcrR family transcriptional regulator, partial [Pyxidicoccus fallax]|uniref:TetR/AcrR family transcriptional regulator n=1 Tax=Pyxidicoccus fallax TaxID=394095 RepID=UPI001494B97D